MGYCEIMCQLCGVSFAIARLRRADEDEEAAWDYWGFDYVHADEKFEGLCGEGSGCTTPGNDDRHGEHVAGPACVSESGYSGHRISLAEMEGCRAIQCLVKKDTNWIPESDDEDFEIDGDYFLTGVSDGSPDEAQLENIEPVSHGVSSININNMSGDPKAGLPFHPTCFDIYKKVSEIRIGRIDTEGLFYWRHLDCNFKTFFEDFPRGSEVRTSSEQYWRHQPGYEYLVANPIDIPGLSQLLKPSASSADKNTTFVWAKGPDDSRTDDHLTPPSTSNRAQDPFLTLSAEVASMVLDHLGSKDIANLRLATPVFRELPTILFRRLFFEDMPWLWEASDLEVASINWYDWYCKWKSGGGDLKGLQNRKRIWRDVEEVIRRVQKFRKEGKISGI